MKSAWPSTTLDYLVRDLTRERTFVVHPDDEVTDPTISSSTHTVLSAGRKRGSEVQIVKRVRIEPSDLVFSRLHTQNGAFGFAGQRFQATTTFIPFSIREDRVDRRFLFWALHQFVPSLSTSDSVGRETFRTEDILGLTLPLPSIVEQRRIVAQIENLRAHIQEALGLRGHAEDGMEALGASTARAMLDGAWSRELLEDLCIVITDGTHQTPRYVDDGAMFLSAQNVKPFRFMPVNHRKVSRDDFRSYTARIAPQRGDVLLTRVGAGIGEAAVVDQDIAFAFYVSLALIRTRRDRLAPEFLVHWFNSPSGRANSRRDTLGKGHSQGNLNLKLLRRFQVPVPPLPDQLRIVAEWDAFRAKLNELKRLQASSAAELDALMPSILDRAFRGEL